MVSLMTRKKESSRIPRPPNAFILYRSHMTGQLPPPPPGTYRKQGDISRMISALWHNESRKVKAEFQQLALIKKLEHEAKYPGYKYTPRSKEQRERESRTRSHETDSHASTSAVQDDYHSAISTTGNISMCPPPTAGSSPAFEMTPTAWSQQDIEEAFKALQNLGSNNYQVQSDAYVANEVSDEQLATGPLYPAINYASPQAYGEYVPSSYEASFDLMLREFTGGQFDHWHMHQV